MPKSTPGVYIEEKNAFPNSIVPVATAVPAFLGYTEKAIRNGENLTHIPARITSFNEYLAWFGGAPPTLFELKKNADPQQPFQLRINSGQFLLYYSLKFYFANGGGDCYIVSVGDYSSAPKLSDFDGADGVSGLASLLKEPEPTLVVIPDAVLLPPNDCYALQRLMLLHCQASTNRFAIMDVYMDINDAEIPNTPQIVSDFRSGIGSEALDKGAAYYPFLHTTIVGLDEIDYTCIDSGSYDVLIDLLNVDLEQAVKNGSLSQKNAQQISDDIQQIHAGARGIIDARQSTIQQVVSAGTPDVAALHKTLSIISLTYKSIIEKMQATLNLLPPSGAIAGIYVTTDNSIGVFQSPANVSVASVINPRVILNDQMQQDLNTPLDGKAVNAIRVFPGKGVLVWGARTLDGNSQDWRYISVRRSLSFIEQSVQLGCQPYVFEPNTEATWATVRSTISNFLHNFWAQGGLAGAKPDDAFSVQVGLGSTMTQADILNGIMRITVLVAVVRPAEFIAFSFEMKMQGG